MFEFLIKSVASCLPDGSASVFFVTFHDVVQFVFEAGHILYLPDCGRFQTVTGTFTVVVCHAVPTLPFFSGSMTCCCSSGSNFFFEVQHELLVTNLLVFLFNRPSDCA